LTRYVSNIGNPAFPYSRDFLSKKQVFIIAKAVSAFGAAGPERFGCNGFNSEVFHGFSHPLSRTDYPLIVQLTANAPGSITMLVMLKYPSYIFDELGIVLISVTY
jgi:hypothetical protein